MQKNLNIYDYYLLIQNIEVFPGFHNHTYWKTLECIANYSNMMEISRDYANLT